MRCVNKDVIRLRHPSPTTDDILISVLITTSFCKFGLKGGFYQLESSLTSHSFTTFQIKRRKKVTRTCFWGYNLLKGNMPSREIFPGIKIVANIPDDIFTNFLKGFYCD